MRILITGAAGMLGARLAQRLASDGALGGRPVSELVLLDAVHPELSGPGPVAVRALAGDLADPALAEQAAAAAPETVFHLAAVVSGEAEADLEKGYRVNVEATHCLFEGLRRSGLAPRFVFASSIAVFGPPLPEVIGDEHPRTPATSYGTQKAIVELMLDDYTRRGLLDGVGVRLPTICVRPGAPNQAASGFFSGIIREPLHGQPAILPVSDDVRHWFASPRAAVEFLLHAAMLPAEALGAHRSLTMPGLSATVAMEIEALRHVAGESAVALIERRPDETIARMVAAWPQRFDARRALALGFRAESSVEELIRVYLEDELGGRVPGQLS